jgi:hypothetical protein
VDSSVNAPVLPFGVSRNGESVGDVKELNGKLGPKALSRTSRALSKRLERLIYNSCMSAEHLLRVQQQLRLYEHPLLEFDARAKGDRVEVVIRPRFTDPPVHTYVFELHPRDLDDKQFEWAFQRQLFDCLHDYLVEMFIRTPQQRKERQQIEQEGKL